MQHTIYFGDKPLFIVPEHNSGDFPSNFLIGQRIGPQDLQMLTREIEEPRFSGAVLVHKDPEEALLALKAQFEFIQAAGGLVRSEKGNLLLIFRKGKWDLPKGKLDPGEDLEQCAVREVAEETGLEQITLQKPLCRTYHTYHQFGQRILKESHWYLMSAPEQSSLKPQTEEDIQEAIWVHPADIETYLNNIHRSVADVLKLALPVL